jgi:multisubunit Na+/H+ antiporter MnhE subunit
MLHEQLLSTQPCVFDACVLTRQELSWLCSLLAVLFSALADAVSINQLGAAMYAHYIYIYIIYIYIHIYALAVLNAALL